MDKWNTWRFYELYMTLTKLGTEHTNGAGVYCKLGDLYEIYIKLKSREISFINNTHFSCLIVLIFCTENGSHTAVLCTKSQSDWTIEKLIRDRDMFVLFELKSYIKLRTQFMGYTDCARKPKRGLNYSVCLSSALWQRTQCCTDGLCLGVTGHRCAYWLCKIGKLGTTLKED